MATSFSFSGNFLNDDDLAIFTFTLAAPGDVTIRTSSYADGGFDPTVTVFSGIGGNSIVLAFNEDAPDCLVVNQDPNNGACWDSYFELTNLAAGTYTAVLSQYDNNPGTFLSDPFSQAGNPNYTAILNNFNSSLTFIDLNKEQRTSFWAIDFLGATTSVTLETFAVPEPSTFAILGGGLIALWVRRSRIQNLKSRQ